MAEQQWELSVQRSYCQGSGVCVSVAPGHFALRGGRAEALHPLTAPDDRVLEAAETCPMEAVFVHEAGTGSQLAPPE
ncbi:ferredoxin [Streptomyces sp. NPDC089919]|uniref:ferredoxin n=1 Tax=Streptomyces sp. NPDC089919 TaxID=3155188 RepID=UPI00344AD7CD